LIEAGRRDVTSVATALTDPTELPEGPAAVPNIRADRVEQSTAKFLPQHQSVPIAGPNPATSKGVRTRGKSDSLAISLSREALLLRSAGSSGRAIAAALGLSLRRVQTIS
jgi:hypothetical protein